MRRTARWMQQVDERILEYVREEGWATPETMEREPEFRYASEERLRERCEWLVYAGLMAPIAGEMVELTSDGRLYLEGEVDAEYCPRPAPGIPVKLEA